MIFHIGEGESGTEQAVVLIKAVKSEGMQLKSRVEGTAMHIVMRMVILSKR